LKKRLLLKFINPFLSIGAIFTILVVLYSLSFSTLYHPDPFYIFFLFSFVLLIFFCNIFFTIGMKIETKVEVLLNKLVFTSNYIGVTLVFFVLGTLANTYEYTVVGWPIFLENKVTRGENLHYLHYVTNFLIYSLLLSYVGIRLREKKMKFFMIFVFILSLVELLVWLNRGPMLLLIILIFIFELLIAIRKNSINKYLKIITISLIIFILLFGLFGDMRVSYVMENIYGHTINYHYGMNEWVPTSLVWIYIYSTSTFENFRDMFYNQEIIDFKYGLLLVYPFVAPFFKQFYDSQYDTYPYLDDIAGLNVSSFLESAFNDFFIFGPYIYVLYMSYMFSIGLKFFDRGIYGFLAYISVLNMGVWMFFVNGFAIGPFMIGFIFFIILSLIFERKRHVNY